MKNLIVIIFTVLISSVHPQPPAIPPSANGGGNLSPLLAELFAIFSQSAVRVMEINADTTMRVAGAVATDPAVRTAAENLARKAAPEASKIIEVVIKGIESTVGGVQSSSPIQLLPPSTPPPPFDPMSFVQSIKLPPGNVMAGGAAGVLTAATGGYLMLTPEGQAQWQKIQKASGQKGRQLQREWEKLVKQTQRKGNEIINAAASPAANRRRRGQGAQRRVRGAGMSIDKAAALTALAVASVAANFHCAVRQQQGYESAETLVKLGAVRVGLSAVFVRISRALITKSGHYEFNTRNALVDLGIITATMASITFASSEFKEVRRFVLKTGSKFGNACHYMAVGTVENTKRAASHVGNACRYMAVGTVCNARNALQSLKVIKRVN